MLCADVQTQLCIFKSNSYAFWSRCLPQHLPVFQPQQSLNTLLLQWLLTCGVKKIDDGISQRLHFSGSQNCFYPLSLLTMNPWKLNVNSSPNWHITLLGDSNFIKWIKFYCFKKKLIKRGWLKAVNKEKSITIFSFLGMLSWNSFLRYH